MILAAGGAAALFPALLSIVSRNVDEPARSRAPNPARRQAGIFRRSMHS
ncbi:MAG: hypothetical protein SYR96_17170 [Actinomycetota bacterium]|nr:hypothetical protein [Actinomycetota bacterium]